MNPEGNDNSDAENPTIRASLKRLPGAFWVLFAGSFVNRFGTFVLTFLALYLNAEGFSAGKVAVAVSSYGGGSLVASLIGGYLTDRIGRRRTMAVSLLGAALFTLLLGLAGSFPMIVFFSFSTGLCGALYYPASSALVADLVPEKDRLFAFAVLRFGINAGWAFGSAAGGFIAQRSYLWLFYGDAFTSAVFGLLALFALPDGCVARKTEAAWSVAIRSIRANRPFLMLLAGNFAISLVFVQTATSWGPYVTGAGYTTDVFGLLLAMNGAMIMAFELLITRLTQRVDPVKAIAVGFLLIGAGFSLNAIAATLPVLVLAMVVLTVGEMIALPVSASYSVKIAPGEMRGRYMGMKGFVWSLATFAGPAIGLRLVDGHAGVLWISCGVLGVAGALCMLGSGVGKERRTK